MSLLPIVLNTDGASTRRLPETPAVEWGTIDDEGGW